MLLNILGGVLILFLGFASGGYFFGSKIEHLGTIYLDGKGMSYIKFDDGCTQATLEERRYVIFEVSHVENASKSGSIME